MRFFAACLIFFGVAASYAQAPQVPHKMHFAGMTLTIRDDARREIQKDVDALTQSPRYFTMKVERAKTYFPTIERIFKEERLPEEFKYLVLQESALISDAVSVSNAVGFWQFKDFTAREVGLRVDDQIDERMNIVSASRGAARYLKSCNIYFNNWIYALQAYQMGPGGVQRSVGTVHLGARHMEINSATYWYVKKFLAHKVAFEPTLQGDPQIKVTVVEIRKEITLNQLAEEMRVAPVVIREYNKWARVEKVPADRTYAVVVPSGKLDPNFDVLMVAATPALAKNPPVSAASERHQMEGLSVLYARPGETLNDLVERSGIGASRFFKFNDIDPTHRVREGVPYFLARKRKNASKVNVVADQTTSLWAISQREAVQLRKMRQWNPDLTDQVRTGDRIWLTAKRVGETGTPWEESGEIRQLDSESTFNWGTSAGAGNQVATRADETHTNLMAEADPAPVAAAQLPDEKLTESPGSDFHEVKASDTLYGIARQYGVTIKEIMDWNSKTDFNLAIGERLRVRKP